MIKGTEIKCWRRSLVMSSNSSMVSKQTLRFTARLFTKTFFQTMKTPKIIFENNTWPHLCPEDNNTNTKRHRLKLLTFQKI